MVEEEDVKEKEVDEVKEEEEENNKLEGEK